MSLRYVNGDVMHVRLEMRVLWDVRFKINFAVHVLERISGFANATSALCETSKSR